MTQKPLKITILGTGSWGMAIGRLLANKKTDLDIVMWDKDLVALDSLKKTRKHPRIFPWLTLPDSITLVEDCKKAVENSDFLIIVVPSHAVRPVTLEIAHLLDPKTILVNCAKGLEPDTLKSMSQVLKDTLPKIAHDNITVLSGPSHAEEVSKDIPTTVTISGSNNDNLVKVQDLFTSLRFRVYTNPDLIGVEMGGSLKNVIAIAAGACDGMGFGDNSKAAIITRGLAEITRLGVKLGAHPATFSGLAGLGDLVVTCTSRHSRNRKFGELRSSGATTEQALTEIGMVVEGVKTTEAAYKLGLKHDIQMPITKEVYAALYENKDPKQAVLDLMTRDPKAEIEHS